MLSRQPINAARGGSHASSIHTCPDSLRHHTSGRVVQAAFLAVYCPPENGLEVVSFRSSLHEIHDLRSGDINFTVLRQLRESVLSEIQENRTPHVMREPVTPGTTRNPMTSSGRTPTYRILTRRKDRALQT